MSSVERGIWQRQESPVFMPAGRLARVAQLLIMTSVVLHAAQVIYVLATSGEVDDVQIMAPTYCNTGGFMTLVDIPACIIFCMWWYRAAMNVRSLHAVELIYSPSAAVWSFFVPLLNLVRPLKVGQEIWKASDPTLEVNDALSREKLPEATVISSWWTCLVIAGFMRSCGVKGSDDLDQINAAVVIISYVLFAAAGIAAVRLVGEIQRRQESRYNARAQSQESFA